MAGIIDRDERLVVITATCTKCGDVSEINPTDLLNKGLDFTEDPKIADSQTVILIFPSYNKGMAYAYVSALICHGCHVPLEVKISKGWPKERSNGDMQFEDFRDIILTQYYKFWSQTKTPLKGI